MLEMSTSVAAASFPEGSFTLELLLVVVVVVVAVAAPPASYFSFSSSFFFLFFFFVNFSFPFFPEMFCETPPVDTLPFSSSSPPLPPPLPPPNRKRVKALGK